MKDRKIVLIRGPLGVGKSTIAKELAEKIDAEYLSLDKIIDDNNLSGEDGIPLENFLKSNEIILKIVSDSEKSFVIDDCYYYQEQIDDLQEKLGNKIMIFSLVSDVQTCIERDSARKKVYGEDSARFVHMITSKVKSGHEIDNANLSVAEAVEMILKKI
jgi:cytidylate kinase